MSSCMAILELTVLSKCQLQLGLGSAWRRGEEAAASEARLLRGGGARIGSERMYSGAPGVRAVQAERARRLRTAWWIGNSILFRNLER